MLALLAVPAFLIGLLIGVLIVPQKARPVRGRWPQDE